MRLLERTDLLAKTHSNRASLSLNHAKITLTITPEQVLKTHAFEGRILLARRQIRDRLSHVFEQILKTAGKRRIFVDGGVTAPLFK